MNKFWFRPKTYGYGLCPISWEGWVSTLAFVGVLYLSAYANDIVNENGDIKNVLRFLLDVLVLTSLFLILSKNKTDGEIRWQWGKK